MTATVVKKEALRELERLSRMPVAAAEYTVSRTYLDWMVMLPWDVRTEEVINLQRTRRKSWTTTTPISRKRRTAFIEYLAVRKLNPNVKGPILCFRRPAWVSGKTSLGEVDRVVNRSEVRPSITWRDAGRG